MIPTASEFRELQSKAIIQKADESNRRFIEACDQYKYIILDTAKTALESVREKGLTCKYVYLDFNKRERVCGYTWLEMLFGPWTKEIQEFDNSVFTKFKISKPFDVATQELAKLGYTLKVIDVPDFLPLYGCHYIKLSWDEHEEHYTKEIIIKDMKYVIDENGIVYNNKVAVGIYNIEENKWIIETNY